MLFLFLGILVGSNHRRKATWSLVISKLWSRLSSWNGKNLSLGGKVTLLNSSLNNILIFMFSFLKAPLCILEEIMSIQRNFL